METTTQLYWLTRLDSISMIFSIIAILGFFILIGIIMFSISDDIDYEDKSVIKRMRIFFITFIISLLGVILIPTKDEVVFIIAGGKTIDFIKNDTSINKIPSQTTKLITDYLEEQINKNEKK